MTISKLTDDLRRSLEADLTEGGVDVDAIDPTGRLHGEMRIMLKALYHDLKKNVAPVMRDIVWKHFGSVKMLEYDDGKWAKKQFEAALWAALDKCYEEYNIEDT